MRDAAKRGEGRGAAAGRIAPAETRLNFFAGRLCNAKYFGQSQHRCMSRSSWTATAAGRRGAACRAPPAIAPASRRSAAWSRRRPTSASRRCTLFAFSVRQLAPPAGGGRRADAAAAALSAHARCDELVESGMRLTVIGRRDRLPDGLGAEIAAARSSVPRAGRRPASAHRDRLLRARCDRRGGAALAARARHRHARGFRAAASRKRRRPRRRPAHPHRRREAAVRLPALGKRLRRAALRRDHVARFRRGRPERRDRRFPRPRAPLRRARDSGCARPPALKNPDHRRSRMS